ncbi:MAG: MMPL family transporter [Mycobacterium sp.]|uniref:MMPL family transporter n=1 Tax=Mycobacterium sp. TaxID=1785 RepID=UPI003BB5C7B0
MDALVSTAANRQAQIGTIVCIGVLLDTLVVRTLLVPALVQVLGERFWWPAMRPGSPQLS